MFALTELLHILTDAWHAVDLGARLREWWWAVTHQRLLDGPPPAEGGQR